MFVLVLSLPKIIDNIGIQLYGELTTIYIFIGIANILSLGLPKLVVVSSRSPEMCTYSIIKSYFIYLIMYSIITVVAFGVFYNVKEHNNFSEALVRIFTVGTILLICEGYIIFFRSILEAQYKIYLVNIGYLLQTILLNSLLLLASFSADLNSMLYCFVFGVVCMFFYHSLLCARYMRDFLSIGKILSLRIMAKHTHTFATGLLLNSGFQPLGRMLILWMTGNYVMAGIFDIILRFSGGAQSLLFSVSNPTFAYFANNIGNPNMCQDILAKFLKITAMCYVIGIVMTILFIDIVLSMFSINIDVSKNYFLVCFACITLYSVVEPIAKYLASFGYQYVVNRAKSLQYIFFLVTSICVAIATSNDTYLLMSYCVSFVVPTLYQSLFYRNRVLGKYRH